MNWIIKQIFYLRYLVLKQGKATDPNIFILPYIIPTKVKFYSKSFEDLQWLEYLPWYKDSKAFQDWNTYGIFSQQYGKFYFKAKLDGLVTNTSWPATWLLDMRSREDVAQGNGDHPFYYEVDIELMKNHLMYTIHTQHNGHKGEKGYKVVRSLFANRKLYRNLQKDFHLFLIDWTKDSIVFYINGIRCAKFRNEIHSPLQIIISKCEISKVIVK